jgi:hypothetical protein
MILNCCFYGYQLMETAKNPVSEYATTALDTKIEILGFTRVSVERMGLVRRLVNI